MSYTAKSVIIDVADNWDHLNCVGIRSIDFYLNGSIISMAQTDYSSYETTKYNNYYASKYIFDTSLSKIGSQVMTSWQSSTGNITNQRISCVFNTEKTFDEIIVNNYHATGTTTNEGAKNVKIYISDDSITSIVYGGVISNSTLIFDGLFNKHVESNVEDPQTLTFGEASRDNKLDIAVGFLGMIDLPLSVMLSKEINMNVVMDILLSSGIITRNMAMDINVGDGNKRQDLGVDIMAVTSRPEFRYVYAMNLSSVIKEIQA